MLNKVILFVFLLLSFNIFSNNDIEQDSICSKNTEIPKINKTNSPISYSLFLINEDEGIKNLPIFEFNYHIGNKTQITFFNTGIIRNNIYGIGIKKTF